MRRRDVLLLALLFAIPMAALSSNGTVQAQRPTAPAEMEYEDGTYRGSFMDRGEIQVNLQFDLRDNIVTGIQYRHLQFGGSNCLEAPWGPQYQQAIQYLIGKDIRVSLDDLYNPGDFVDDVDGFTGATIRAGKPRSAIRDALNRGVYRF